MVIAIIAILAAILLPVLGRARDSADRVLCLGNQRQMLTAAALYQDESDKIFPYQQAHCDWWPNDNTVSLWLGPNALTDPDHQPNWIDSLIPYLGDDIRVLQCPASEDISSAAYAPTAGERFSYRANGVLTHFGHADRFNDPSAVTAFSDDAASINCATARPLAGVFSPPAETDVCWSGWMRYQSGALIPNAHGTRRSLGFFDGHAACIPSEDVTSGHFGLLMGGTTDGREPDIVGYVNATRQSSINYDN